MEIKKALIMTKEERECISKFFVSMINEYDDMNFYDLLYAIAFKKQGYWHGEEFIDIVVH